MHRAPVYIIATGLITAVGANTAATQAAVAAGISGYAESMIYNKEFHPMRMALIAENALPPLNPALDSIGLTYRQKRILRIAEPALLETLDQHSLVDPPVLFLALPESIPGCEFIAHPNFLEALEVQTGISLDKTDSQIFTTGRAGGIEAIDAAINYLATTGKSIALVGGLETHMDLLLLRLLDNENRIMADNTSDAFTPGEAGGFLLLINEKAKDYLPNAPLGMIYPPGFAAEPGHRYSGLPYRGEGMAQACTQAIKNSSAGHIDSIHSSLNGENIGAKEMGVAILRNKNAFAPSFRTEHPADCIGDIGAASAQALITLSLRQKPGTRILHTCSSECERRAALVTQSL